ncbi:MAG TPA: nuclear transport factor 2 family protein [bacterium]
MRKLIFIIGVMVIFKGSLAAFPNDDVEKEKSSIKQVIEAAYVKGIHIDRDPAAIRRGFHPDFTMLVFKDNQISKVALEDWIARIEEGKKKSPTLSEKTTHNFEIVDLSGNAAIARIELFKDGKHVFTDYMSLYKFDDGWKIVNKIFYRH